MSKWRIFILLFFVSLVIYANVLNGDFLLDDTLLIINNDYIKSIKTVPLLFTTMAFNSKLESGYNYYRPMQTLSFAVDYSIWKLNPIGYHMTNILIHTLNAFLIFYLIYSLFSHHPLALLSSVLFCVHPIHTESVSYISGRSELLVSLFTLLTLVFYIGYLKTRDGWKHLISIFAFIFALLSRETGFLMLVPLFILIAGLRSNLSKKSIWSNFLSFTGLVGIYIILRHKVIVPIEISPRSPFPLWLDALNFLNVLIGYTRLMIFPYPLYILRTTEPITSLRPVFIIPPVLFLISVTTVLIILARRKKYALIFGIAWFILVLLYLIRFMHKYHGHIAVEEHWAYLASVGFFVILSYLVLSIKRQRIIKATSVFIIVTWSILTVINNRHLKDEIGFYRYNLKFINAYVSVIPRLHFVPALYTRGFYKEAIDEVNFILSIAPENREAYIELGDIYKAMKKFPQAKEAYKKALEIDYFYWQANLRLKQLTEEMGESFKDEVDPALSPTEAKVVSFIRMGNFPEAIKALKEALSVSPTPKFYTLAGITLGKMGLYNKAIDAFNAALKMDAKYSLALYNLAVIYEIKKEFKKVDEIIKKLEHIQQK